MTLVGYILRYKIKFSNQIQRATLKLITWKAKGK